MPRTPFPNGWKGENGLYTVGFTRRGLLGTALDAVKIAEDVSEQWRNNKSSDSHVIQFKEAWVDDDDDAGDASFGLCKFWPILPWMVCELCNFFF